MWKRKDQVLGQAPKTTTSRASLLLENVDILHGKGTLLPVLAVEKREWTTGSGEGFGIGGQSIRGVLVLLG
jgi:hypothetical protein